MTDYTVSAWPIDRVLPHPDNPRFNDGEAVEAVARSIQRFGFQQPIVVDADGIVIAGHTRLKAARLLGLAEVPVHVAADLDPVKVREYRIADNRLGELAEWDWRKLADELRGLEAPADTLFSEAEIANLLAAEWPDAGDPEEPNRQAGGHAVHFTPEQWRIVEQAISAIRADTDPTISQTRAVQLICEAFQ